MAVLGSAVEVQRLRGRLLPCVFLRYVPSVSESRRFACLRPRRSVAPKKWRVMTPEHRRGGALAEVSQLACARSSFRPPTRLDGLP